MSESISRLAAYYSRHGFGSTVRRVGVAAKRALFSSRMVLFYCDLSAPSSRTADLPNSLKVERHINQSRLSEQDLHEITSFWNPRLAARNIKEGFEKGASLWLIKVGGRLVGYGWTLRGHTVEPHYFPFGPDDIHLFNFYVFPQYRGKGVNPLLVNYILRELARECRGRVFIEAAEWNHAQMSSLGRTPFRRLGLAKKFTLSRHTIVCWDENSNVEHEQTNELDNAPIARTVSK
jgi:GNAT superfamily N-acetyltransferase